MEINCQDVTETLCFSKNPFGFQRTQTVSSIQLLSLGLLHFLWERLFQFGWASVHCYSISYFQVLVGCSPRTAGVHCNAPVATLLGQDPGVCGFAELADPIHAPGPALLAVGAGPDAAYVLLPELRHLVRGGGALKARPQRVALQDA